MPFFLRADKNLFVTRERGIQSFASRKIYPHIISTKRSYERSEMTRESPHLEERQVITSFRRKPAAKGEADLFLEGWPPPSLVALAVPKHEEINKLLKLKSTL